MSFLDGLQEMAEFTLKHLYSNFLILQHVLQLVKPCELCELFVNFFFKHCERLSELSHTILQVIPCYTV